MAITATVHEFGTLPAIVHYSFFAKLSFFRLYLCTLCCNRIISGQRHCWHSQCATSISFSPFLHRWYSKKPPLVPHFQTIYVTLCLDFLIIQVSASYRNIEKIKMRTSSILIIICDGRILVNSTIALRANWTPWLCLRIL